MKGKLPNVAPAIIRVSNASASHFFQGGHKGLYSLPLLNIKKTLESPHVRMNVPSVSSTSVSPSRNDWLSGAGSATPPRRISRISAP